MASHQREGLGPTAVLPTFPKRPGRQRDEPPRRWSRRIRAGAAVGALHGLASFPALRNALFDPARWTGPTDFPAHASVGMDLAFPSWWDPGLPHFLVHGLVEVVGGLLGTSDDPRVGMLIVAVAWCGVFGAVMFQLVERALAPARSARVVFLAALISIALAFAEAPTVLFGWSYQNPPDFFLPLNAPHSPTSLASRPLSIGLLLVTWRFLDDPRRARMPSLAALALLAMVAKPAYAPSVAGAASAYAWFGRHQPLGPERLRRLGVALLMPVTGSLAIQYWLLQRLPSEHAQGLGVAPFVEMAELGAGNPLFWTSLAFPIAGAALLGRRFFEGASGFAVAAFGVSLLPFVLLSTPDERMFSSEMLHYPQQAIFAMSVMLILRVCQLARADWVAWRARVVVLALVALPSVVGGWAMWSCQGGGACLVA